MKKKIKFTNLLDPHVVEKYQPELLGYFEKGGTWKELLGYSDNLLATQYKTAYDLYQTADFKNASAAFSYLTMIDPYEYTYWMGLALSKQSDRQIEEAIVAYTVAEAIDPTQPIPHLHLAQCYWAITQKDLAIKHLRKTIKTAGKIPEHKEAKGKAEAILKKIPK